MPLTVLASFVMLGGVLLAMFEHATPIAVLVTMAYHLVILGAAFYLDFKLDKLGDTPWASTPPPSS